MQNIYLARHYTRTVLTVLWAVFDVYRPTGLFGLPRWVVDFELVMVVIVLTMILNADMSSIC